MLKAKFIVAFNAIIFGLVGFLFLFLPAQMSEFITGSIPITASGLMDMRATYGGVTLSIGIILHTLNRDAYTRRHGLIVLLTVLSGMALGRIVGMLIDGPANTIMYVFLAYEFLFIGLSVWMLMSAKMDSKF